MANNTAERKPVLRMYLLGVCLIGVPAAARAANDQIQLAIAESKCGDSEGPRRLCTHLKQAQAEIDNTIYRINGSHD